MKRNTFKKHLAAALLSAMAVFAGATLGGAKTTEAYAATSVITEGLEVTGTITDKYTAENVYDVYKYTVPQNEEGYYKLAWQGKAESGNHSYVTIGIYTDATCKDIVGNKKVALLGWAGDEDTIVEDYSNKLKPGKTYYIRVEHTGAYYATVKYSLTLIKYSTDDYISKASTAVENVIELNKETKGIGNHIDDVDYFSFVTSSEEAYYKFTTKSFQDEDDPAEYGRVCCDIYEDEDMTISVYMFGNIEQGKSETKDLAKLTPNKRYFVKVHFVELENSPYKTIGYSIKPEIYSVDDHKDDISDLTAIAFNNPVTGTANHSTDVDYYSFTTDSSNSFYAFNFSVDKPEGLEGYGIVSFKIFSNKEMTDKIVDDGCYIGGCNNKDFAKTLLANHTYYVQISCTLYKEFIDCHYTINVSQLKDDVADEGSYASKLTVNTPVTKVLQHYTDEDVFAVTTTSYTKYNLTFKNISKQGTVSVYVYTDKACTKLKAKYENRNAKTALSAKEGALALNAYKTYYIKVKGDENVSYTVGLNATAPSNKVQKVSKQVKVTWSKVDKAQGYEVWRSVGGGKYTKVATIKNAKTITYTDKTVKTGKTYKYKIRAYAKKGSKTYYSAYSAEKSIKVK